MELDNLNWTMIIAILIMILGVVGISGCSVPGMNKELSSQQQNDMLNGKCPNCGAYDTLNVTSGSLTRTFTVGSGDLL